MNLIICSRWVFQKKQTATSLSPVENINEEKNCGGVC